MQPVHVVHGQPVITKCIKCTACKSDQFSHNRHKQLVDCLRPLPPPLLDCDHLWPVGVFFNCWSLWRFQEQEFKVETILRLPVTRSAVETETLELAAVDGRGENSYEPLWTTAVPSFLHSKISPHFISFHQYNWELSKVPVACCDMPRYAAHRQCLCIAPSSASAPEIWKAFAASWYPSFHISLTAMIMKIMKTRI